MKFTNFEGTIFEKGQSVAQGRGFLAPAAALDALKSFGFNLLSLSNNHAFDLKGAGLANMLKAVNQRGIAHAGTGNRHGGSGGTCLSRKHPTGLSSRWSPAHPG